MQIARKFGVFGATLITFFLAEMGDKTQIATVAMAAHYPNPVLVVIGTALQGDQVQAMMNRVGRCRFMTESPAAFARG